MQDANVGCDAAAVKFGVFDAFGNAGCDASPVVISASSWIKVRLPCKRMR